MKINIFDGHELLKVKGRIFLFSWTESLRVQCNYYGTNGERVFMYSINYNIVKQVVIETLEKEIDSSKKISVLDEYFATANTRWIPSTPRVYVCYNPITNRREEYYEKVDAIKIAIKIKAYEKAKQQSKELYGNDLDI